MGHKIVLTADKTLMSSYNASMFIGFAACFPRVLPKWLYSRLFCPSQPHSNGMVTFAPCGLRKIQASLIGSGIPESDIAVAHPEKLDRVVNSDTKVLGITTSDPMGLGPASSTFCSLLGKEAYTAYFFRTLLTDSVLKASKAKVIVGGPGAWQLANDSVRHSMGIDTLVEGEGEVVAPQLFRDAVEGKALPETVEGGVVPVAQIPAIRGATINGTVEISRGCGRGCEFCNPNMRQVRHIPRERIIEEVKLNLSTGSDKITLHAEDVLRYHAKEMIPEKDKLLRLFEDVLKLTDNVGISHLALSSALAKPDLVEEISRITGATDGRKHMYCQTGIETGSPDLVSRHMKGKAKPYSPGEWPEVVREAFKLLVDNNWIPCGTLVMGLPGEKAADVSKTIDLIGDLRTHKCLVVPLFFVPLGDLKEDVFFRPKAMLPEHWILLAECIEHDFHWVPILMDELFAQNRMSSAKSGALKLASWYMQRRLRHSLELMKTGKSPLKVEQETDHPESYLRGPQERAEA